MTPYSRDELARLFALQDAGQAFEWLIERLERATLRAGDHAVDGGAHGGLHTRPMAAAVGRHGRVHAFEPIPSMAEDLERSLRDRPQVVVHAEALGETEGTAAFFVVRHDPALSSLRERPLQGAPAMDRIDVPVVQLDRLAGEPIRLAKLDLEGGEYHALLGARALLAGPAPTIVFECGRAPSAAMYGYDADAFFGLFEAAGYGLVTLFGQPFTRPDFARGWDDREIPHYLVAAPTAQIARIAGLLEATARQLLADPAVVGPSRWGTRTMTVRRLAVRVPGARRGWRFVSGAVDELRARRRR